MNYSCMLPAANKASLTILNKNRHKTINSPFNAIYKPVMSKQKGSRDEQAIKKALLIQQGFLSIKKKKLFISRSQLQCFVSIYYTTCFTQIFHICFLRLTIFITDRYGMLHFHYRF